MKNITLSVLGNYAVLYYVDIRLAPMSREGLQLEEYLYFNMSRVSSGGIVSDYGLDDRAIGVRSPAGAKDFSSSLCVQTGSWAHPASCTNGTGGPLPGGKARPGA
jgi:hypothetical protein